MVTKPIIGVTTKEIKRDMFYQDTLILTYSIQYPQFFYENTEKPLGRINLFYKAKATIFQSYCENDLYKLAVEQYKDAIKNGFPVRVFEAMMVYEVTYNENCTISLYFDQYEYTGGAHGNTTRYSNTWSVQSMRRETMAHYFPRGFDYKKYLIANIIEQIEAQIIAGENVYFENYKELVIKYFDPKHFFLTPSGMVVYFQQYEIAPYSSGIVQFVIPYSKNGVQLPNCR